MNKLKEIWDQLRDNILVRWEQFQETDTYISLRDRYDNLSPRNQKIAVFSTCIIVFLMVFSIPYAWFAVSRDSVSQFEDTKNTIQELLQVSQESKSLPADGQSIGADEVRSRIDKILGEKGISKDQIVSVVQGQFVNPQGSNLLPAQILSTGVDVNLHKLNLKQIVDLGYEFDHIAPLVKILNMEIRADKDDVHFYDVGYRVSTFSVKEAPAAANGKPTPKMPPTKEQPR